MSQQTYQIGVSRDGYSAKRYTEDGPIEIWVETFQIVAETQTGHRWQWGDRDFDNAATTKSIMRHLIIGTPATSDRWLEIEPRYGSEAWGSDDEYNLACFEADCFGEPRPRW
jgi:hypothetical protein